MNMKMNKYELNEITKESKPYIMDFIYRRQETSFFLVHLSKLAANCLMGPVKFLALAALTTQIFRLSCSAT